MQDHVGITMAGQATSVGDFDAAQHYRPVACEGVSVEAHAGPRDHASREPFLRFAEVGGRRQLVEGRIAFDSRNTITRSPDDRGRVGRGLSIPTFVARPKGVEPKGLWGLNSGEAASVDWL